MASTNTISRLGAVCGLALASAGMADEPRYELIDLGTLGGQHSMAYDMNDQGMVVGWSETGPPECIEKLHDGFTRACGNQSYSFGFPSP